MFQIPQGQSSNVFVRATTRKEFIVSNPIGTKFKLRVDYRLINGRQFQIPQGQSSNSLLVAYRDPLGRFQIPQGQSSNALGLDVEINRKQFQIPQGQSSNLQAHVSTLYIHRFKSHRDKVQMSKKFLICISLVSFKLGCRKTTLYSI